MYKCVRKRKEAWEKQNSNCSSYSGDGGGNNEDSSSDDDDNNNNKQPVRLFVTTSGYSFRYHKQEVKTSIEMENKMTEVSMNCFSVRY